MKEIPSGNEINEPAPDWSVYTLKMAVRAFIVVFVFALGGLPLGAVSYAQEPGQEDEGLEYRQEAGRPTVRTSLDHQSPARNVCPPLPARRDDFAVSACLTKKPSLRQQKTLVALRCLMLT